MLIRTPKLGRRDFLKGTALAGGGLLLAFHVPRSRRAFAQDAPKPELQPNAFLRIGEDDSVTVLLAHSEMGQGVWTTLPMLINEELGADWDRVRAEHAPADKVYAHVGFGVQATGGSTTTWTEFERYRKVGAMARDLLVRAAAGRFGVDPKTCSVADGVVSCGEHSARFGELAAAAAQLAPDPSVALKAPSEWTRIGKATKRLDGRTKVDGSAQFGIDVRIDGMATALVAHAPTIGATVKSFDATQAKALPGVIDVVQVPTGVAVIAEHYWAAKKGRDALELAWDGGAGDFSSKQLVEGYRKLAREPGASAAAAGDAAAALGKAGKLIEAEYDVPYLAHATMEPLNCAVRIGEGECEIWTGTQFQGVDQQVVGGILGIPPERVRITTTFLGGGFGRRASPTSDFIAEAVQVAKAAGRPVKLVWSREDDTRGGWYRPAFVHRIRAALGEDGKPVAWEQRIVGQSIMKGTPFEGAMQNGIDPTATEGASDSPYLKAIPDHRVDLHLATAPVSVLWWRSVGHTHTAFAMESFIDELAHAAKQDPLDYRRALLAGHPRPLKVMELAAEKAGWGSKLPEGRARGLAVHESFGSFVAQVAEVSVENDAIRVHRVVCAIDCGLAVNPDGVVAQMESGIAYGLGAALHSRLDIKDGKVQQSNFHDYRILRFSEMPKIEVLIHNSGERMGGAGEPGTPPIAPAVANAVFALTGKRLRSLPLNLKA